MRVFAREGAKVVFCANDESSGLAVEGFGYDRFVSMFLMNYAIINRLLFYELQLNLYAPLLLPSYLLIRLLLL